MTEAEDHTLRLLREMRGRFDRIEERMDRTDAERREQLDRIEAAVVGMSYFQATERGEVVTEIEGIKTRLDRIERRLDLADAPAE